MLWQPKLLDDLSVNSVQWGLNDPHRRREGAWFGPTSPITNNRRRDMYPVAQCHFGRNAVGQSYMWIPNEVEMSLDGRWPTFCANPKGAIAPFWTEVRFLRLPTPGKIRDFTIHQIISLFLITLCQLLRQILSVIFHTPIMSQDNNPSSKYQRPRRGNVGPAESIADRDESIKAVVLDIGTHHGHLYIFA